MRRLLTLIGMLIGCAGVPHASAQVPPEPPSLYEHIRTFTVWEEGFVGAELNVEKFVAGAMRSSLDILPENVDQAYRDLHSFACQPGVDELTCNVQREDVLELAERTEELRGRIRTLGLYSAGHESTVLATPRSLVRLFAAILWTWQSDDQFLALPPHFGSNQITEVGPELTAALDALAEHLRSLVQSEERPGGIEEDWEKLVGAVHRYGLGVTAVRIEDGCNGAQSGRGDGTPLQFLTARFCDVEDDLQAIAALVLVDHTEGVLALRTLRVIDDLDVAVVAWGREDGTVDAGLRWNRVPRVVLPSLDCSDEKSFAKPNGVCVDGVILGGTYPDPMPDPESGEGICAIPPNGDSYLCRPIPSQSCPPLAPGAVPLARCAKATLRGMTRWTESGPNVCLEGGWRLPADEQPVPDTPALDPDLLPDECSNCVADLVCVTPGDELDAACGPQQGRMLPKDAQGRIILCLREEAGPLLTYLAIHELVHVQQSCNLPSGSNEFASAYAADLEKCCAIEYQANLVACGAMAQDGILTGVNIDLETCAAALSNFSCGGEGVCSDLSPGLTTMQVYESINQYVSEHAEEIGLPRTCSETVERLHPRAQMIKNSLPQVCSPTCPARFRGTIGNLLCYVGQCIEQTFEGHTIAGRMPLPTFDQMYPWESERRIPDDETRLSRAFQLTASPDLLPVPLPPYRPRHFIRALDDAFCSVNAQPRQSPPILCQFDPDVQGSRSQFAVFDPPTAWSTLVKDPERLWMLSETMRQAVPGAATQFAAHMSQQYLRAALRPLQELIENANALLRTLEQTKFPQLLCPRDASSTL